jgi:hypothetical protein
VEKGDTVVWLGDRRVPEIARIIISGVAEIFSQKVRVIKHQKYDGKNPEYDDKEIM